MNKIDLIPDMIRFIWKGKYLNGEKWRQEECLFTDVKTDERAKTTTARAYRSFLTFSGEIDGNSMMPEHTDSHTSDLFFYKSVNSADAINALFDFLVKSRFIWENGKVRKYTHTQDEICGYKV